jgi:hypothetical protein
VVSSGPFEMRKFLLLTALLALSVLAFGSSSALAAAPNTQLHFVSKNTTANTAKFHMIAMKNGTICGRCRIQCRIDSRPWKLCVAGSSGTWTFRNLSNGTHTARARAVDAAGRKDATPAAKTVTV